MNREPIVTVVMDSHHCVGLTESDLDEWYRSLPAAEKVLVYEERMEEGVRPHQLRAPETRLNATLSGNSLEEVLAHGERLLGLMRQIAGQPISH